MSETQEPLPPQKDKIPFVPGQPLPRLWKTEPDPEEDSQESLEEPAQKKASKKAVAVPAPKSSSKPQVAAEKPVKSKPAKPKPPKKKATEGEKGDKRVLLEETPKFDTIESRQRARLIMGALMAFCFLIFGWIVYGMLFSGSSELDIPTASAEMPTGAPPMTPGAGPSREPEASYMLDRARDYAKREKTKDAIGMLKRVVSVYKGTRAAAEAQAALDRPKQNLPLFPDGPFLLAQQQRADQKPPPPSTGIGTAAPGQQSTAGSVPGAPPQVAMVGASTGNPTPTAGPAGPVASMNPGTVGPMPTPAAPMNPSPANAGPPPSPTNPVDHPVANSPPPAVGPAPPTGAVAVAPPPTQAAAQMPTHAQPHSMQTQVESRPQPPPGPGEVAVLVPTSTGNATVMPPAAEKAGGDRNPATLTQRATRMLPPGFKAKEEAGVNESGWPLVIVGERDGGTMVLVPGATFLMGKDGGSPEQGPAHPVRLSTFYIDQYEVTNRQFRTFIEDTHYIGKPPGRWLTDEKFRALPDNAPAVFVNYHDAEAYAIWALKRLPTEAQWELAARSADGRRYPWGDQPVRWARERKFRQIEPVMRFPEDVSPYGVFDMAGNALEWARDWYDPRYFDRSRDKTSDDPSGPPGKKQGIQRVVRGGSKDWLVFDRQGMDSDRRLPYLGFRCSLAVEGGEASANIVPHTEKPDASKPGTPPPGGQPGGGTVPF